MIRPSSRLISALLLAAGLALSIPVAATEQAPDALIKNVSDEVISIVRQDKAIQTGDTTRTLELVDKKLLPHFNFTRMTALALGPDWRTASSEQKTTLTAEFRTLLVRSYANALNRFKDYQVSVKPLKIKPDETEVTVRTDVRKTGSQPDAVDYSLTRQDGEWKIYDVSVAGVSLITSYRDSFDQEVRANGIDGLIASLRNKNTQNAQQNSNPGATKR